MQGSPGAARADPRPRPAGDRVHVEPNAHGAVARGVRVRARSRSLVARDERSRVASQRGSALGAFGSHDTLDRNDLGRRAGQRHDGGM